MPDEIVVRDGTITEDQITISQSSEGWRSSHMVGFKVGRFLQRNNSASTRCWKH